MKKFISFVIVLVFATFSFAQNSIKSYELNPDNTYTYKINKISVNNFNTSKFNDINEQMKIEFKYQPSSDCWIINLTNINNELFDRIYVINYVNNICGVDTVTGRIGSILHKTKKDINGKHDVYLLNFDKEKSIWVFYIVKGTHAPYGT